MSAIPKEYTTNAIKKFVTFVIKTTAFNNE